MARPRNAAALIIVFCCLELSRSETEIPPGLKPLRSVSRSTTNDKCEEGQRLGCADCSTVQVCQWNGNPIESSKFRCDSVDRTKPYCTGNTGVCSEQPSADCVKASDLCPSSGIFPQPINCREMIYCDNQKNAYVASCATGQAYKHSERSCVRMTATRDCFQLNCAAAGSLNQWFPYTPAPQLYVFCSSVVGPMTFQCEGENQIFNQRLKRCDFSCPSEGNFAIPGEPANSQRYYQCVLGAGRVLQANVAVCPGPLVFNPETRNCGMAA